MNSRRLQRHSSAVVVMTLSMAAIGCGHSGADSPGASGPGDPTSGPTVRMPLRQPDLLTDGEITLDENGLRGVVHDQTLALTIPVSSDHGATGTLQVAVVGVDATNAESQVNVGFELDAAEHSDLHAELALPQLTNQADRIRYSVRVRKARGSSLQITRSLLQVITPYELRLEGPAKLRTAKQASYRVRAEDPIAHRAVPDATVSLELQQDGNVVQTLHAQTDDTGSAVFDLSVKDPGSYSVAAQSDDQGTKLQLASDVNVEAPGQKLLVTTDKPLYQPGQTIHLRALYLQNPGNAPLGAADVVFEVQDARGNKVAKKHKQTDDYGIASLDFQLANLVNMGTFKVRASAGQAVGEKTVEVAHYTLPKFAVDVSTDKPWYTPSAVITGNVDSRYFFGKQVSAASVMIEALTLDVGSNVFARLMGQADDAGHFGFTLQLPANLVGIPLQGGNALVTLRTSVTDSAGQVVTKEVALTVASQPLLISLVPEATSLVEGLENRLQLFVTDPLGAPVAAADVSILWSGSNMELVTDEFGHAEVRMQPDNSRAPVQVSVTPKQGAPVEQTFAFSTQLGEAHVLLRTDKSVYALGETVKVSVFASSGETHAYLDWQNEGQSIDMRTLELQDGSASFEMPLDSGLLGENRIDAYVLDAAGNSVRTGRTVIVNREGALQVALSQDKPQYQPGETAQLTLTVTNQKGEATPAALGVQIVDEAVFGLIDAQPGLLRTFFELEDAFAKPSYELHVPSVSFDKLLFEQVSAGPGPQRAAAQSMAEAQLSALTGNHMLGIALGSWSKTVTASLQLLAPALDAEKTRLIALLTPTVKRAVDSLTADGCADGNYYYCNAIQQDYLEALRTRVFGTVMPIDFWGNAYVPTIVHGYPLRMQLTSRGADERGGSTDDPTIQIDLSALGIKADNSNRGFGIPGAVAAAGGAAAAAPATPTLAPGGDATASESSSQPRVRKSFPETLYTNPALITDGSGKVTVPVELADSITSWRVSALANSRSGDLGGGQAAVTVFQDFFVDVSFPAELTRGDSVEFPVVVYNYRDKPQTVRLELEQAAWFTATGSTTQSLTLGAGEVRSVNVPVRVDRVGVQSLTVRAFGDSVSDAVARTVRVIPDGSRVPSAQSGSLASGGASLSTSFPTSTVEGSGVLYLDVFPAFLSQAVQGLDSMLQVPGGCFEQTTSTTWPNVLVESYMQQTHQITPEIQLKAESLIAAGYQRLLTFEHKSGGFSWFGEQDAMADISVTAFGLMEFADMSKVQEVDEAMVARTQKWLVAQQASDGSWKGGMTEFFSFQTSSVRNTAFVVWALAQSGYTGPALESGLDYLRKQISDADDAYTVALAANALAAAAPNDTKLTQWLDRLQAQKHKEDGKTFWDSGSTQTNFYGGGRDSEVATTALVAHAFISANQAVMSKGAVDYLTQAKDANGNFGSTQASVWALKTLLLAALHGTEGAIGKLDVSVDGKAFGSVALTKEQSDVVTRLDMTQLVTSGGHSVALTFAGTGQVSYNLVSSYNQPWAPQLPGTGPLALSVAYDRTSLAVDDSVSATVKISNQTAATQRMLLVTLGLPPGFELESDDLSAYVANGQLSRFEQTGRQLILYVTALAARSDLSITYRLRATMPVRAADGGGQVQLYYQPDQTAKASSQMLVASAGL